MRRFIVKRSIGRAFTVVLAGAAACGTALAQTPRSPGQAYVYELTVTHNVSVDFSNLPAGIRGQAAAQEERGNKTPVVYVLTLDTDRVNPDGSAHVNVSFTNSLESGIRGADPAVFARFNQFAATLDADGRLIPQYDPSMRLSVGAHGMSPPDEIHNQKAGQMADLFADFNTFAGGCAERSHTKSGGVWRVDSHDRYGLSRTYDFSASAGASPDVATVTMKGAFTSPTGSDSVDGNGHYDAVRRLVIDLHLVDTFKNAPSGGPASSGTTTMDYHLK